MAKLSEIVGYLDEELNIGGLPDYGGAMNGLQLENGGEVTKVAAAVDASLPVFEKAVAAGADLLIVHHGMFWQGAQQVTGAFYKKLKLAMDHGMAVYSAHLPLDVHAELGNNAILAREIEMEVSGSFLEWKGMELGLLGEVKGNLDRLVAKVGNVVDGPVHVCRCSEEVGLVGLITGGAGSELAQAAKAGVKTFITGEGPHWSFPMAEELGVNVLYAGHYATETFGVRAVSQRLGEVYGVESLFIAHPTGL